jgi:serine protease Do
MRAGAIAGAVLIALAGVVLALQAFDVELRVSEKPAAAADANGRFWQEVASSPTAAGSSRPSTFADLVEQLSPAVVNVKTENAARGGERELFEEFFGRQFRPRRPSGTGSGFVISPDGYIVTNHHVVENAEKVSVAFEDGKELPAEVVGRDSKTDLALLKVAPEKDLKAAPLGDSDGVRVGDWVMAIGNPFGLDHTVTVGILSARGRNINAGPYDDFLQTDASINPGNSGGPLIDLEGRVIGINTAINAAGQGIGFAIPINMAKDLLPQLKAHGSVTRGWLGVQIQKVTPALARSFGLEGPEGALVSQVFENSPAAKAKVERGDVIVEFNGHAIKEFEDLPRRVAATPPGSDVEIVVLREGKRTKLSAQLDKMDAPEPEPATEKTSTSEDWGFDAQNLSDEIVSRLGLPDDVRGALVTDVAPDSPAEEAGMRPQDVVVEIDRKPVEDVDDLEQALASAGKQAVLLIQRGEGTLYLALQRD